IRRRSDRPATIRSPGRNRSAAAARTTTRSATSRARGPTRGSSDSCPARFAGRRDDDFIHLILMKGRYGIAAIALLAGALARAQDLPAWPDTFETRVQALALIQTLNAEILGSRSATATLERWCRDHKL